MEMKTKQKNKPSLNWFSIKFNYTSSPQKKKCLWYSKPKGPLQLCLRYFFKLFLKLVWSWDAVRERCLLIVFWISTKWVRNIKQSKNTKLISSTSFFDYLSDYLLTIFGHQESRTEPQNAFLFLFPTNIPKIIWT